MSIFSIHLSAAAITPACPPPSIQCQLSALCLPLALVCDGRQDCPQGDDEVNCPTVPPALPCPLGSARCAVQPSTKPASNHQSPPAVCQSPQMPCPLSTVYLCVAPSQFCDGHYDCPDGFDERDCPMCSQSGELLSTSVLVPKGSH